MSKTLRNSAAGNFVVLTKWIFIVYSFVIKAKAINDFIALNYKGWTLHGVASEYLSNQCEENAPCDVHLVNGKQNKIITIILKQFYKPDGTSYWFVRDARQIDLAKLKIEAIKEREKQATLENLEFENCEHICEDASF